MSEQPQGVPQIELTARQKAVSELLNQGRIADARTELVSMLADEEPQIGPFHERIVSGRLLLARLHALMGEPDAAEQILSPLQAMPDDHPGRLGVFLNAQILVATICRFRGRLEDAFALTGATLESLDSISGDPVNPDSFRALIHLIEIARDGQQYQQALDLCGKGIERFQGKVGEAHAHLVLLAGSVFLAAEQYDQAREHFEAILQQVLEQGGEAHELAIRARQFLAQLESDLDQDALAIEHLESCLKVLANGGDPELIVEIQQRHLQLRLAEMPAAEGLKSLEELRELAEKIHGPRSTKVAEIWSSLGYQHRQQGQGVDARRCYESALGIWRSWREPDDVKVTTIQETLAQMG
ncbi:MAG: tetratricopeptide repeat protein [Fibrobacteres bacterium]|nr:tetratricopeptide repeat protein [Fibrobacterota bacterium]